MTCFVPAVMTAAPGRLTSRHIGRASGLPLGSVIDATKFPDCGIAVDLKLAPDGERTAA